MSQVFSYRPETPPDVTDAVLYAVTKGGTYLNQSGAKFLIGRGDVKLNGQVSRDIAEVLSEGTYRIGVLDEEYHLQIGYDRIEG